MTYFFSISSDSICSGLLNARVVINSTFYILLQLFFSKPEPSHFTSYIISQSPFNALGSRHQLKSNNSSSEDDHFHYCLQCGQVSITAKQHILESLDNIHCYEYQTKKTIESLFICSLCEFAQLIKALCRNPYSFFHTLDTESDLYPHLAGLHEHEKIMNMNCVYVVDVWEANTANCLECG